MNDPIVVTRELVKRGWSDFEPKLVSAMLSGSAAGALLTVAHVYGIPTPDPIPTVLPLLIAGLAGYLTPSVGTAVTKKLEGNGSVKENHSGNVVSTITSPTQIVRGYSDAAQDAYNAPPAQPYVPPVNYDSAPVPSVNTTSRFTGTIPVQKPAEPWPSEPSKDVMPTERLGSQFLNTLPSAPARFDEKPLE